MHGAAAAFRRLPCDGVVDENAPHHACGDREELCSIIPVNAALVDQAEVSFVNEGGRLQRVVGPLLAQVIACELPQLVVNTREHIRERLVLRGKPAPRFFEKCGLRGVEVGGRKGRSFFHPIVTDSALEAIGPTVRFYDVTVTGKFVND